MNIYGPAAVFTLVGCGMKPSAHLGLELELGLRLGLWLVLVVVVVLGLGLHCVALGRALGSLTPTGQHMPPK